ncbi:MAG: hypothetical protein EOP82_18685 [Variovorax sp.]|nr:MAG: hypothetical protein EOP82_18685 [Variovorax sp.]
MGPVAKPLVLSACFVVLLCADIAPEAPMRVSPFREAWAIIGAAPGGSVVRRRAVVGTVAVASSTANANAAAAANANAAAAASRPPPPAAPAGPPAVGSMVTTLPPGCVSTTLNGVEHQRCGSTYYRAGMQGSNLVFVVSQP